MGMEVETSALHIGPGVDQRIADPGHFKELVLLLNAVDRRSRFGELVGSLVCSRDSERVRNLA